jgi:UDPglucose--hexose-1-phosphate uridylyltransferase
MAELRMDPTTGNWIIVGKTGAWDDKFHQPEECPFCPGKEEANPPPITTVNDSEGNWLVRVFPDRSPVFSIGEELGSEGDGVYDKMHNFGAHEIIIENPRHGISLSSLEENKITQIVSVYRDRISDLKKDSRLRYILIFKNHGAEAGSHINHVHSHLIATPVIPQRIDLELQSARKHYQFKERCLFCDIVRQENEQEVRVVDSNEEFIAFCPFAPRFPYETWILPLKHFSSFQTHLSSEEILTAFAALLKKTLQRIEAHTSAYHVVLHISPNENSPFLASEDWDFLPHGFHWHLEILPRISRIARLKREEEFFTNPLTPEEAARKLKAVNI